MTATEEQIKALEKAHKEQLANLVQAGRLRIYLAKTFGIYSPQFIEYNLIFVPLVNSWATREQTFEQGGAPKLNLSLTDFSTITGVEKAANILKTMDLEGKGIGWFIVLVWAATIIYGFFTAEKIIDETHNTAQEQSDLIKTTSDFCQKYNLNAEECKKVLTSSTSSVTSSDDGIFSGITSKIGIAIGLFVAYKLFTSFKTTT